MAETIKFIDRALDEVVQKNASKFSSFQKYLEETSTDLKNLEKWLQSCAICIPVFVQTDDEDVKVGWDNKGGTWRLLAEYPVIDEDLTYLDTRPVIEMPIRGRLVCRRFLPALIKEISDLLPSDILQYVENDLADFSLATADKKLPRIPGKTRTTTKSDDLDVVFASQDEIPF